MIDVPHVTPVLEGRHVKLRATTPQDSDAFCRATTLETFKYFVTAAPLAQSPAEFQVYVDFILNTPRVMPFTVEHLDTGEVIGGSCFLDIRPEDDHLEIGMTWYAESYRGTNVNPECKLLLLTYAFETLGCEKVTLKADRRNEHFRAAITKLGAQYEGTLRRHRFTSAGEFRDTSYYSILNEEWPLIKSGLMNRLS